MADGFTSEFSLGNEIAHGTTAGHLEKLEVGSALYVSWPGSVRVW